MSTPAAPSGAGPAPERPGATAPKTEPLPAGIAVDAASTPEEALRRLGDAIASLQALAVPEWAGREGPGRNLSEPRGFERELVHDGKLAAIGVLAAGAAHEINNPLFAILGLVEFLLAEAEEGSKAQARLELIRESGLEVREIVRALLDFAREPSDDVGLVDLAGVAEKTLELVRRTTPARSLTLVGRLGDEPVPVRGSANQLEQVLLHLVSNARDAVGDEGTVTVEVRRDGPDAAVTVTDDGPGIRAETVAAAFDPAVTTRRPAPGTSLGLAVSVGIATMHGGNLTVESEPGRGARFTLRLPLVDGA